ncbi:MAG: hypothetical protein WCK31_02520 [bacterium]
MFQNLSKKILALEYIDGIREILIGIYFLFVIFLFQDHPTLVGSFITILFLSELIQVNYSKKYIGEYKLKTQNSDGIIKSSSILTIGVITWMGIFILFSMFWNVAVRDGLKDPLLFSNCLVNPCVNTSINISLFAVILPFITGIIVSGLMFGLLMYVYKVTLLKRFKVISIISLLLGILATILVTLIPAFPIVQAYLSIIAISFVVSGLITLKKFNTKYVK